jgi:hypothetical protein
VFFDISFSFSLPTPFASYSQQRHHFDFYLDTSKFSYFLCKLHIIELHDLHPLREKKFHLLHTSKSTAKICAPCSQLSDDLIPQFGRTQK